MANHPNKFSQFWQELKRRRVVHVITVYASAAFVVIELINNLTEPLRLPTNLATIIIIILAVGFPVAVILSWLYDLTSRGIVKTISLEDVSEKEKVFVPNAWKIATIVSFAIIIGLLTINIFQSTRGIRSGSIHAVAILPFDNYTGDEQLDWVADGMHSTLIGDMGRVSGLRVLGKTTSDVYKETDLTAEEIAKKHNIQALVEGTLTCYGEMVCMQVRVITLYPNEKVLWIGDYMEEKEQILNLWNRVTRKIASELKVNLTEQEEAILAETKTIDPDAYDAYLKGRYELDQFNPRSFQTAIESFNLAIDLEPEWAAPYAGIAEVGTYQRQSGIASEADIIRMYEHLNRALELDPNSVDAHHANAVVAVWTEFDWAKGEKEFLKALELNPSFERSHSFYAHLLTILRRTDEALHHGKIAQELDPENPFTLGLYWAVLKPAGKCQEALYYLEKGLSIDPDHLFLQDRLRETYVCLGEYEKAFEIMKNNPANNWDKWGITESLEKVFDERGWMAFIKELTRINIEVMGFDIQNRPYLFLERYLITGEYEKAVDCLEILIKRDSMNPNWPYFSMNEYYDKLRDNNRYLAILRKMNLPIN